MFKAAVSVALLASLFFPFPSAAPLPKSPSAIVRLVSITDTLVDKQDGLPESKENYRIQDIDENWIDLEKLTDEAPVLLLFYRGFD